MSSIYSKTSEERTLWDRGLCPLFGGCPLLGGCPIFTSKPYSLSILWKVIASLMSSGLV